MAVSSNSLTFLTRSTLKNGFVLACVAFRSSFHSFRSCELQIQLATPAQRIPKPDVSRLKFGECFSDHMFQVEWNVERGWGPPRIHPLQNFTLHPASKIFHYGQGVFEGMKAFKYSNQNVALFRPHLNMNRLYDSAERASLPLFDREELLKCLKKLVHIDRDWIPDDDTCSLYIRPTFIGVQNALGVQASSRALLYIITSPVASYFGSGGVKPVSLLADPDYVRAWPGGVGDKKMASNYAPTLLAQRVAQEQGLQQVLWLIGEDHRITEVGAMNVFFHFVDACGNSELVTPPLDGTILPGVMRKSVLELARSWNEFKVVERSVTMKELIRANSEGRLREMFGTGTAVSVCPVASIRYKGEDIEIPTVSGVNTVFERLYKAITDIQYGKVESDWSVNVE